MFDSHCHLHDARIVAEAPALIARAKAAGVERLLLAGVDPEGWEVEDALAEADPVLLVSYGLHPERVAELDDRAVDDALELLHARLDKSRPAALGEIGLDGAGACRSHLERQERAFLAQLELSRTHRLPVLLHIRDAHGRALELLNQHGAPAFGGVVHSYSGSAMLVREYVALGLHLSFAGAVTRPGARKVRAAAASVPRERLLVETDAPDQTPEVKRGRPNEPAFLVHNLAALAEIRSETLAEVAAYTDANARRLFAHAG